MLACLFLIVSYLLLNQLNPLVPEFSFPLIFEIQYNLRVAPIVYRLIGVTLIGNFFNDPFFKIEFFVIHT